MPVLGRFMHSTGCGVRGAPLGKTYPFEGRQYRPTNSLAVPKPVQEARPPIISGGHSKRRAMELAAVRMMVNSVDHQ
jgi:alkanesulfonate monooxygenase SsuD/methylene tetrahydromethanopterin reductase-like flavin-dependent oxidoreductase (luciferase family)